MDNEDTQVKNEMAEPGMTAEDHKEQEDDDASSKSSASGGGQRYYENLLNDMECNLMFLDDAEEHLPEIFDVVSVKRDNKDECKLCGETFNRMRCPRHHCRKCGASVCDLCSQT